MGVRRADVNPDEGGDDSVEPIIEEDGSPMLLFDPRAKAAAEPEGEGAGDATPVFHGNVHAREVVAVVGNATGDEGLDVPVLPILVFNR